MEQHVSEGLRPLAAVAAIWLITNVLTCLISNTAAAVLMLPLALGMAERLGVSSRPFIMVIVYAASLPATSPLPDVRHAAALYVADGDGEPGRRITFGAGLDTDPTVSMVGH